MKVVYTAAALRDLADIGDWLTVQHPHVAPAVERHIRATIARLERWPQSARRSAYRADVRVVVVTRYPYNVFYRVTDRVEILHIHHAARQSWDEI
jgi:plasmid stabilization system protein ParE